MFSSTATVNRATSNVNLFATLLSACFSLTCLSDSPRHLAIRFAILLQTYYHQSIYKLHSHAFCSSCILHGTSFRLSIHRLRSLPSFPWQTILCSVDRQPIRIHLRHAFHLTPNYLKIWIHQPNSKLLFHVSIRFCTLHYSSFRHSKVLYLFHSEHHPLDNL